MLNRQELLQSLRQPEELDSATVASLRETQAIYPWFPLGMVLLASHTQQKSSAALKELLPLVALYTPERAALFRYLHHPPQEEEPIPHLKAEFQKEEKFLEVSREQEEEVASNGWQILRNEEVEEVREQEVLAPLPDEKSEIQADEILSPEEEVSDIEEESPVEVIEPALAIPEPVEIIDKADDLEEESELLPEEKLAEEKETSKESPELEEPAILSLGRFAVDLSAVERENEDPVNGTDVEIPEIPFFGFRSLVAEAEIQVSEEAIVEKEGAFESREEEVPAQERITQEANARQLDKTDFFHWLENLHTSWELNPIPQNPDIAVPDEEKDYTDGMKETQANESQREDIPAQSPLPDDPSFDLIDKFIRTQPSISRPKAEFFNPVLKAKESEVLDDEIITETLARILVRQEKYEKAIEAYKKLQLKFPGKSDYFATLINELKEKI